MIKNPWIIGLLLLVMAIMFVTFKLFIEKKVTQEPVQRKSISEIQMSSDKSVPVAEDFLKQALKYPESYQSISWTELVDMDSIYYVSNTFRSKDSLNGSVVETYGFRLGKNGSILGVDMIANKP
jgi:hypothetical protein